VTRRTGEHDEVTNVPSREKPEDRVFRGQRGNIECHYIITIIIIIIIIIKVIGEPWSPGLTLKTHVI
jgi:uncharacterized membrane protein YkgB